jgi:hypothetical protein
LSRSLCCIQRQMPLRETCFRQDIHCRRLLTCRIPPFVGPERMLAPFRSLQIGDKKGKTDDARGYGHVIRTRIVRGGLQVHTMKESRLGTPFIHSVDIRTLVEQQDVSSLRITSNSAKGRVDGWMVLVPRVGKPAKELIQAVDVTETVQLSDCVIALQCTNKATATRLASRIKESWEDFCGIFRGTGAQYVTLLRLKEWLASRSIIEFID